MKKILILALSLGSFGLTASAQLIEWNVAGYEYSAVAPTNVPPSLAGYASVDSHVNASEWLLGNTNQGTATTFNSFGVQNWNQSLGDLNTAGHISFTLAPTAGYQLNIASLDYDVNRTGTAASNPTTGFWGYRIDGGEWVTQTPFALPTASSSALLSWDIDISTTGTVELGFWAYGGTNPARTVIIVSSHNSGFSPGLVVNGNVTAVPEPSTCLLLGTGVLVLTFLRNRRMKA